MDPLAPFALKPLRAARVSEISETTAASGVPAADRVSFHIGNPVQDPRLLGLYQRLALGLPAGEAPVTAEELIALAAVEGLDETLLAALRVVAEAVAASVPYLPRGGFLAGSPGPLATLVQHRLTAGAAEPHDYDLAARELTFANGGRAEALRILLSGLARNLVRHPAYVHLLGLTAAPHWHDFPELGLRPLPDDPAVWLPKLSRRIGNDPEQPHVLLLGCELPEGERRALRRLAEGRPLVFVEANDAPNERSLAREAGLAERVLRVLTPAALGPGGERAGDALVVVAGSARFVTIFEVEHFRLKGTPSAPEVAWLRHALETVAPGTTAAGGGAPAAASTEPVAPRFAPPPPAGRGGPAVLERGAALAARVGVVERLAQRFGARAAALGERAGRTALRLAERAPELRAAADGLRDPFAGTDHLALVAAFFGTAGDSAEGVLGRCAGGGDPAFVRDLERAFLAAFVRQHPEYDGRACVAVSGSARTALGILGFHGGLREVVTPDLSWTYEHCFPRVHAVPLRPDLSLDGPAIIAAVQERIDRDPDWRTYGAIALNTPHNASGQVFADRELEALVRWALEHEVRVIDDLAYDDVGPVAGLPGRRTIRRIVGDLVAAGHLRADRLRYLVTVHSLSKTDCFAGARLAVAEIADEGLRARFRAVNGTIVPNATALLLATLFLRRSRDEVRAFWALRNEILRERMDALLAAQDRLPPDRNPYGLRVRRPAGAMYPQLEVERLPDGVSLDWLSAGLARRGIGMLPLATFARTERGFDLARRTFRLTLGGTDGAAALEVKMRRVLIDLNRLIAEEAALYTRRALPAPVRAVPRRAGEEWEGRWAALEAQVVRAAGERFRDRLPELAPRFDGRAELARFEREFLPERLSTLRGRFRDAALLTEHFAQQAGERGGAALVERLAGELVPDSLATREERFRRRLFDRTVHPSQMYALRVDERLGALTDALLLGAEDLRLPTRGLARELVEEYLGTNVRVDSAAEAGELVTDLQALVEAEEWARVWHGADEPAFLSFWGDWDGSTRPSGQGHRLVAGALLANVTRLALLLQAVQAAGGRLVEGPALRARLGTPRGQGAALRRLLRETAQLGARSGTFWDLLNEITRLTSQLEARYQRFLPFDLRVGRVRRLGMRAGVLRGPVQRLSQHNDRLERRMRRLRAQRGAELDGWLRLDAALRAALRDNLDAVGAALHDRRVVVRVGWYRDLLRRFALTPRIHQRMVLAADPFAIETTVHNMVELNRLAAAHGVPGFVLAIQVSQSTNPEAFVALDRRIRAARRDALREGADGALLPGIWTIPLFEDADTVRGVRAYLNRLWEYALHSRDLNQDPALRLAETICEVFVAGSDLSQQVSQPAGAALYREAKLEVVRWLAERGLVGRVRIKLGSGEPAQRQGGYYDPTAGQPTVHDAPDVRARLAAHLSPPARRAAQTARTPLAGVWKGGELRTWQSNVAEHLRRLRAAERAELLHHVRGQQREHDAGLERAASVLRDTRLRFRERGIQELEQLTRGATDPRFGAFLELLERDFRRILYGRPEDVVGLHAISYFVSRTVPAERDRPVVRPSRELGQKGGREVLGRIAQTLPLARHGSLLRAIGHNRAQSLLLGVNQLTTGLFRALSEFAADQGGGVAADRAIADVVLPRLPVRDILRSLHAYQDPGLAWVRALEPVFPAGNSAFVALREDQESLPRFVGALQRELVRRIGLHEGELVEGDRLRPALLPVLRPDLAVLLVPGLFADPDPRDPAETALDPDAWAARCAARLLADAGGGPPDPAWQAEFTRRLAVRGHIRRRRARVWQVLGGPVRVQVKSFVELTGAIFTLSAGETIDPGLFGPEQRQLIRLRGEVADLLRGNSDDAMRQFLIAAVQFLTRIPGNVAEVPVEVVRALQDVRRIVRIEEQALDERDQALVRFEVFQMARLAGENG
jgi:aspartate/methionine/tyrosine aminotransferase